MTRAHFARPILELSGHGVVGDDMPVALLTGAAIALYSPGTTTLISDTLFLTDTGTTSVSNPFICTNGVINVYLNAPQRVRLGITPVGGTETLIDDVDIGSQTSVSSSSNTGDAVAFSLIFGDF